MSNKLRKTTTLVAFMTLLLLATWSASPTHAQTPSVTASVDRNDLTLSDVLTLTLRIEGVSNVHPLPKPPVISGLVLVGSERRSHQTFVQGALSAHFEFIFRYQPTRTGAITINSINVILDNVVHVTNPITVNVTGGGQTTQSAAGAMPQPTKLVGQDFFAEAEVDDETPYIGQQITHTLRFYSANVFARPIYDAPDFAGFWNPGRSREEEGLANAAGRSYRVTDVKTILFPTLAGNLKIEPTNVSVRGGLLGTNVTDYPTREINLNVRPLPPGEPDAFTGAVGRFSVTAAVDTRSVELGDPVTLAFTVSGEGNMESLPAPSWPDIPGWRAFDSDAPYQLSILDGKIQGYRKFQRVFMPTISGTREIPPVEYAYFDPYIGEYVTLTSQPFKIEVLPDPSSSESEPSVPSKEEEESAPDIRYIKPAPGSLDRAEQPFTSYMLYWALWLIPVFGIGTLIAWLVMTRRRAVPSDAGASSIARETVLAQLSNIESGASAADAASAALHSYLDVRLGRATGGLPAEEISSLMERRGVSSDTCDSLANLLSRITEMRFSPSGQADYEDLGRSVEEIVRKLDREFAD